MSEREKKTGTTPAVAASSERREVQVTKMVSGGTRQVRSAFHFDEVLTSFSTQSEVFSQTLDPLVDEVLSGYEATCFAYGQTGTGKTYTMEGDLADDASRGLVPRTAAAMIERLTSGGYADWAVSCQYLEIYNEELCDLLANPQNAPRLDLKDVGGGRGVVCVGLSEVPVKSSGQIFELVRSAQERRRVAETRINARSSRSHCIFTLKVKCRKVVASGELENVGKLHLVDLAGSECAKKASWDEAPFLGAKPGNTEEDRERKNINQSLLTLGRVISALRDGTPRVPYRDSKLTRLLQDALGGRSKTVIIATISPALAAVEETISTLTYAEQAAGVKNRPVASSLLRTIRLAAGGEPRCGFADGVGLSGGDFAELELKVAYLTQEVEEAQGHLAMKYREAQELLDRATQAEERLQDVQASLSDARRDCEEKAFVVAELEAFADDRCAAAVGLSSALDASTVHGDELRRRLDVSLAAAAGARRQARTLLEAAEQRGQDMAIATRRRSDDIAGLVGAAYAAHEASMRVAEEAAQEQRRLVAALTSEVREGGRSVEASLAEAGAAVRDHVAADEVAASRALEKLEVNAGDASAAAARCTQEVDGVAAQGEAAAEQRALAVCEAARGARKEVEEMSSAAVSAADAARSAAANAHEAALALVEGEIQRPLGALDGLLQELAAGLGSHTGKLVEMRTDEQRAGATSLERWGDLKDKLGAERRAYSESSGAGREALGAALAALAAALATEGDATDARLAELGDGLSAAASRLREASQRRSADATDGLEEASALLSVSWSAQRGALQDIGGTLQGAAAQQRAANDSARLSGELVATKDGLNTALGAAIVELMGVRDRLAEEVAELQARRSNEQELVRRLTGQREMLQKDTAVLKAALGEARAELVKARGELGDMEGSQAVAREKLLEDVVSLLRGGLGELAAGVSGAARCIGDRLVDTEARLEVAASAAEASEAKSAEAVAEASAVAHRWSASVGESCEAVVVQQERLRRGYEDTEAASRAATEQIDCIAARTLQWGEQCDQVASSIDAADARRSAVHEDAVRVEQRWQTARGRVTEVVDAWSQDVRDADEALAMVLAANGVARVRLDELRAAVLRHHRASEASLGQCERRGGEHNAALAELLEFGAFCIEADRSSFERRDSSFEARHGEAVRLEADAAGHPGQCQALLAAVGRHLKAMPGDHAAPDAAIASAATSIGAMSAAVDCATRRTEEGAEGLREAQVELAKAARGSAVAAAAAASGAHEAARQAAAERRAAGRVASEAQLALWSRAAAAQRGVLSSLAARCDEAEAEQAAAADTAARGLGEESDKGCRAKDQALQATEDLAAGTAAAMTTDRRAIREALAAQPLSALDEHPSAAAPQRPLDAERPGVELRERPSAEALLEGLRRNIRDERPGKENEPGVAVKLDFDAPNGKGQEQLAAHGGARTERKVLGVLNKA